MDNAEAATGPLDGITVVTEPSAEILNQRQLIDYRTQREQCLEWLVTFGKNPDRADGYATTTVSTRSHRMDQFYRWVWEQEDGYTANVTHEHADGWLKHLARQDYSNAHKSNCRKSLLMLYKWREHERGLDEWTPEFSFVTNTKTTAPRDYLTREERSAVREAALEYASIPAYSDVTPEQRDRWKGYLAQRFQKPKSEVTVDDWEHANGWKIPSLVWVSLDAALRPIEVERAVTSWVDIENGVLRIPKEQSSKNRENWIVGLQQRTVDVLERWLRATRRREHVSELRADRLLTCQIRRTGPSHHQHEQQLSLGRVRPRRPARPRGALVATTGRNRLKEYLYRTRRQPRFISEMSEDSDPYDRNIDLFFIHHWSERSQNLIPSAIVPLLHHG